MSNEHPPHDVFISYAREDSDWVRRNLYEPLAACRTLDGRPARIFFDVGEHGIQIGDDFQTAIDSAIERALKFIPVYSSHYFHKEMCILELKMARQRDRAFSKRFLLPILKDLDADRDVPFAYQTLNWQSISDPNWFSLICQGVGLTPSHDRLSLRFLDQPRDVFASHTLPRIRIELRGQDEHLQFQDQITIRASHGSLLGTSTVKTENGVAVFSDLSLPEPAERTRLIARCTASSESLESDPFSVVAIQRGGANSASIEGNLSVTAARTGAGVRIAKSGELVFYSTGQHLLVLAENDVSVFAVDGTLCGSVPLRVQYPHKLVRRNGQYVLLADWAGNIQVVKSDGTGFDLPTPGGNNGFCIPADADFHGNDIFIAYWDGCLYRVNLAGERELYLREPAGLQVVGVCDDRVMTCDFEGTFRTYRQRRPIGAVSVEPVIWSLKETPDCLIAIGNEQFYHISRDGLKVRGFGMPIRDIDSVYELSSRPVVMDAFGKGIRFNTELAITSSILTQPGACPVAADDAGDISVFRNPDGTHTLQQKGRIVFSTKDGPVAVSPTAEHFALSNGREVRVYPAVEFFRLVEAQSHAHASAVAGAARSPSRASS